MSAITKSDFDKAVRQDWDGETCIIAQQNIRVFGFTDTMMRFAVVDDFPKARNAMGVFERLKAKSERQDQLQPEIDKLFQEITRLEDRIAELEDEADNGIEEEINGHDVTLSGDGIKFGCTSISKSTLAAISKLL